MKISDGFDARRLRPKSPSNWRSRVVLTIAALITVCGLLMALTGMASLVGHSPALGELNASPAGAALITGLGLLVTWLGIWMWRRRRRYMRQPLGLSMSAHLMKKHD